MKKILSVLLLIIIVSITFVSCGKSQKAENVEILCKYDWYTFLAVSNGTIEETINSPKEDLSYMHFNKDGTMCFSGIDSLGNQITGKYKVNKMGNVRITMITNGNEVELEFELVTNYHYKNMDATIPVLTSTTGSFTEYYTDYDLFFQTYK